MARKGGPDSIGLPGCAVPTHSGQHRQNSQMPVASTIGPCAPASVDQVSLPSDSNVGRAMTAMPANPNHSPCGLPEIGRATCRESVCQYVEISGVDVALEKKTNH